MKSESMDWVFDPVPPSKAKAGGSQSTHVFTQDLDTLVREVLQNSRDQARDSASIIRVKFTLAELSGEKKKDFLAAFRWSRLLPHLRGVADQSFALSKKIRHALADFEERDLLVLRIEDCGTRGLVGREQGDGENFAALCRNVLDTPHDSPRRGGSYGLGKAVLWAFSSISTVLFYSRFDTDGGERSRFIGRTELASHAAGDQEWTGSGWYGEVKKADSGMAWAASTWDAAANAAADPLYLRRMESGPESGTSIMVVGFSEPEREPRACTEVAEEILASASRWFWPILFGPKYQLEVTAVVEQNGDIIFHRRAELTEEIEPFVEAMTSTAISERAVRAGEVAADDLNIGVPPLRDGDESSLGDSQATLRLLRREASGDASSYQNKVALVRGAGMVVRYRPVRAPLDDLPVYAVLLAGGARGQSGEDIALEGFLRASEPPQHDDWRSTTRLTEEYERGGAARLADLWRGINEAVDRLIESDGGGEGAGPKGLAKLFPIHGATGGGGRSTHTFRAMGLAANFAKGRWTVSGSVKNNRSAGAAWSYAVEIWLDSESGRGTKVPVALFESRAGQSRVDGGTAVVSGVPPDEVDSFEAFSADVAQLAEGLDPSKTRIRVQIRATKAEA